MCSCLLIYCTGPTLSTNQETTDREQKPKLPELIGFHGRNRTINIPEQISTKYYDFGVLLLEDDNGAKTDAIEHKNREDPYRINCDVLKQWLGGEGRTPVNWKTLTTVLREIKLTALAKEIEECLT